MPPGMDLQMPGIPTFLLLTESIQERARKPAHDIIYCPNRLKRYALIRHTEGRLLHDIGSQAARSLLMCLLGRPIEQRTGGLIRSPHKTVALLPA